MSTVKEVIANRAQRYQLERPVVPTMTDGYAIDNPVKKINIDAHVQPLSSKELRNLAPGQNASDWRNVWSLDEVKLRDRIKIEGAWFTVQREESWKEGEFWHVHVTRAVDQLSQL